MDRLCFEVPKRARIGLIGASIAAILCLLADSRPIGVAAAAGSRAHQHGAGELNIVIDEHDLLIDVRLPARDVIGFEHPPTDAKQKARVQKALKDFSTPGKWFVLPAQAQCEIESVRASVVGIATGEGDRAHSHSHKHQHEHDKSDKDSVRAETHSDFEGMMQFHCDKPTSLTSLTASLFTALKNLSSLTVQFVGPGVQTRTTLTRKDNTLTLEP